jgi:hypothetical protein
VTLIDMEGPAPAPAARRIVVAKPGQGTGGNGYGRQQSINRFWSHVDKSAGLDGCWLWMGSRNEAGYGKWGSPYWPGQYAHRIAFLIAGGRIPKAWEVDHECHNRAGLDCPLFAGGECPHRACVNPAHLAAVTVKVNRANRTRKPLATHCPKEHPFDEANTYVREANRVSHAKYRDERNGKRAARRKAAA